MDDTSDADSDATELRTFLVADIRGYTRFTEEHGDEAAARLTATFAQVARDVTTVRGGRVIELRGDEALAVFGSARQALRAALDLRDRCLEVTAAEPNVPLLVGIGLDAGEAVSVEDGFRGAALNLAARLCSIAGPGEVLAGEGLVHLARRTQGLVFKERSSVSMKGFTEPLRVFDIRREGDPEPEFKAPVARSTVDERPAPRRPSDALGDAIDGAVTAQLQHLADIIPATMSQRFAEQTKRVSDAQHPRVARQRGVKARQSHSLSDASKGRKTPSKHWSPSRGELLTAVVVVLIVAVVVVLIIYRI